MDATRSEIGWLVYCDRVDVVLVGTVEAGSQPAAMVRAHELLASSALRLVRVRAAGKVWEVHAERVTEEMVGTVTGPDRRAAEAAAYRLPATRRRRIARIQSVASARIEAEERRIAARHRRKGWRAPEDPDQGLPVLEEVRALARALRAGAGRTTPPPSQSIHSSDMETAA